MSFYANEQVDAIRGRLERLEVGYKELRGKVEELLSKFDVLVELDMEISKLCVGLEVFERKLK